MFRAMIEPTVLVLDDSPLFNLPLAEIWFVLIFFILGMFLFLDGFDFGIGALFATRQNHKEKEQLLAAVGPFWDGNEVWLVVFGGALFAAFPAVYANLFSRFYLLMFAILATLALRGLAPEMYEQRADDRWQRSWGIAFVIGSVATPFLLGLFVTNWLLGTGQIFTLPGIVIGLALVALTVADGAAFLGIKTRGHLRAEMRRYGMWATTAYLLLIIIALSYLYIMIPSVRTTIEWSVVLGLVTLSAIGTVGYVYSMHTERQYLAFGAVAGLVFALVGIIASVMYPLIDRAAGLTVQQAVVSTIPLNLMTIAAAVLIPLVFIYFGVLYSVFRGPVDPEDTY